MSETREKSILFEPKAIGSIVIPNRFVRSATQDFMAGENGRVTDRQIDLFRNLAEGEVGLIITGHAYISRLGIASPFQIGIDDDALLEGLRNLAEVVHRTPSRIFIQIAHAGRQTKNRLCGGTPVCPSAVPDPVLKISPREMTAEEIKKTIVDFVQAAVRAKEAGFDGIQIHAAHGYLLSSFLSPHTNRRTDEWGGSPENRRRLLLEILRGIRRRFGRAFPVIMKINATDFLPGGLDPAEAIAASRAMEAEGLDAVEVSAGTAEAGRGSMWPGLRTEEEEGYFVGYAADFKAALSIPVFGLGGNRTFSVMERIVRDGRADFISLSRPLVREPDLVRRFRLGLKDKSACISCNKCSNPRGLSCGDLRR